MCAKWLVVLAAWVVTGCSGRDQGDPREPTHATHAAGVPVDAVYHLSKPHPGLVHTALRTAQASDRVGSDPRVSDDAQQIAELRKLYDHEIDTLFDSTIERIKILAPDNHPVFPLSSKECRRAFWQRKDRAGPRSGGS